MSCSLRFCLLGLQLGRFPVAGLIPYSISKFGVVSFTAGLRRELSKYGIRVVAIEPGFIQTPMIANMVKAVEGSRLDHSKTLLKDADYGS
jgi:NAD(P)-dependent dehydrogenase (short-subunit alcohol dehydrogenase family)